MFYKIYLKFILLLFVCYQLCEESCATHTVKLQSTNELNLNAEFFKIESDGITVALDNEGNKTNEKINVKHIGSVFFAAFDGLIVSLAEGSAEKNDIGEINLLAKFIETKNGGLDDETIKNNNDWKLQLAAKKLETLKEKSQFKYSAVVVKDSKIYYIRVSSKTPEPVTTPQQWNIQIVVGKVIKDTEDKKIIKWTNSSYSEYYDSSQVKDNQEKKLETFKPSGGFSFVIGDKENIIFFIKGEFTDIKDVTALFQFNKNDEKKLKLLDFKSATKYDPYLFQWKEEIYKTPANDPKNGDNEVMVFSVSKNKFTESKQSITRLRDFLKDKNIFVTATIDKNNILFLMQKRKDSSSTTNDIYLWLTDGNHVANLGSILPEFKETFLGSLVYTENNLFVFYQKNKDQALDEKIYIVTQLKEQQDNITKFLTAWKKNNEEIPKFCAPTDTTKIPCSIDGLVGFLSGNKEDSENWNDEYLVMNATVTKNDKGTAEKIENGFKFSGENVGAKLPIIKQHEGQAYNFTDPGFTLVATVKIESNTETNVPNSVLGFSTKNTNNDGETTDKLELQCGKNNKWALKINEKILQENEKECDQEKTYSVALVFEETKNLEIYVDGIQLTDLTLKKTKIAKSHHIAYFYFGAYNEEPSKSTSKSFVTIKNVMLYNRPFAVEEILKLKTKQNENVLQETNSDETNMQENIDGKDNNLNKLDSTIKENDASLNTLDSTIINTEEKEWKKENMTLRPEASAVRVYNSVIMLYLFLGVWVFVFCLVEVK